MSGTLNFLLQLHFLVAVAAALSLLLRFACRSGRLAVNARAELRLQYLLFAGVLAGIFLPASSGDFRFEPVARVMAPAVSRSLPGSSFPVEAHVLLGEATRSSASFALGHLAWLALAALAFGAGAVALDYLRLRRALRGCVVFREIGRVRLAAFEGNGSPFSVLTPGAAWVAVPASMLGHSSLRLAVAHELQHHRAGDTFFCQAFSLLRAFCFFHPLLRVWGSVVAEAQELACDEALVSSQKKWISARNYSECLVHAAETAARGRAGRAYAAAPALFSERRLLKRRFESMYSKRNNNSWIGYGLGIVMACSIAVSAGASQRWVVDSRITMEQAESMAELARQGTDFPIAVNDDVLRYLNKYLGTVKGREFVRGSLERLEALRPRFEAKLAQHRAPVELLAVGMIESEIGRAHV